MPSVQYLPYQGPPVEIKPKHARQHAIEIPFADLRDHEQKQVDERFASHDPYEVLIRKVSRLAAILNCSEAEAEHLMFERL